MKRKRRALLNSNNLLLDTLCNTLGGVVFIALLVSLLSFQAPMVDPDARDVAREDVDAALQEAYQKLEKLPSTESLEAEQKRISAALERFSQHYIPSKETSKTLEELIVERAQLSQQLDAFTVDLSQPEALEAANVPKHIDMAQFSTSWQFNWIYLTKDHIIFYPDSRYSIAEGMQVIRSGNIPGMPGRTTNGIGLFVDPQAIETFHMYRESIRSAIPSSFLQGMQWHLGHWSRSELVYDWKDWDTYAN